jgi:hypothetical protein
MRLARPRAREAETQGIDPRLPFQLPIKGDMDRALSNLMHDARHRLMIEKNRIMGEASMAGALQSNRVIVTVASFADQLHDVSMKQAAPILLDFIQRMQLPPAEITEWARPHLENLGNALLEVIPPNNFPADHKRIVAQYRAVFQQRLYGVLRDVEIGFVKGAGFARAEQMESKEEWITAAEAARLLKPTFGTHEAQMTICNRAHSGMIRARAQRFIMHDKTRDNCEIPKRFWWAEGHQALTQNWTAGDFETWTPDEKIRLQAFGVSFLRAEIEKLIPAGAPASAQAPATPTVSAGGRPPAEFWDELWIEIFRQIYLGELKPKTQADITNAMLTWIEHRGEKASESTVKPRARKLFQALQSWDKN